MNDPTCQEETMEGSCREYNTIINQVNTEVSSGVKFLLILYGLAGENNHCEDGQAVTIHHVQHKHQHKGQHSVHNSRFGRISIRLLCIYPLCSFGREDQGILFF